MLKAKEVRILFFFFIDNTGIVESFYKKSGKELACQNGNYDLVI